MTITKLSLRMANVKPSVTLALNAQAKQMIKDGVDVINLTAGETDFDTDQTIQNAAIRGMKEGHTRYTPSHGTLDLRLKVQEWFNIRWGLRYEIDELTVTAGVKQALFNLMLAVVNDGDEVIVPSPYWVSYPTMVEIAGGVSVFLPTTPESGFRIDPTELQQRISKRTRMIVLNSPNNPTGAIQSRKDLIAIAKILEGTDILVVSDEIYGELNYSADSCVPFASISDDAFSRTVTMNGLSKSHAMTGWRVGFAAGPKSIIKAMGSLMGNSVSNITSFVQDASIAALEIPSCEIQSMRDTMLERRDLVLRLLSQEKNLFLLPPEGAFYCFPDLSYWFGTKTVQGKQIQNSQDLAAYLLEEALVAVVPGVAFGEDRCVRISFATDLESLEKGITRILSALKRLAR